MAQEGGVRMLGAAAPSSVVQTPQVRARLLAHAPQGVPVARQGDAAARQQQPVWVGLELAHQPGWHTYWKNSGDSGLPTELYWDLPPGVQAGDVVWPPPRRIPVGTLVNYGYEGTVLLPVPLTVAPDYQPGPFADGMEIKLRANWLVCRVECIPQTGEFALKLPLQSSTALHGAAFEAALRAQPQPLDGAAQQQAQVSANGQRLAVRIAGLPQALQGRDLALFAETPGVLLNAAEPAAAGQALTGHTWRQQWDGAVWTADWPVAPERQASPAVLPFVLVAGDQAWRAEVAVSGAWPAVAQAASVSPALEAALQANANAASAAAQGASVVAATLPAAAWPLALLGALLGGMALNLMPCVFPVLSIKVLGFARHAQDARARRVCAMAYSAGVVLSFVALGALLLLLRAAGGQLGWGFQLQSPWVVAALAALFTVLGLNLAGLFEFGRWLPTGVASLQARHPAADALLSGVLAVAIASPCTAPFMGASVGLTIALPAAQALGVFVALGVGMALPYALAAWIPQVARCLPRAGPWLDVFRKAMAFPMFGTTVWLVWVLGQQSGIDGAATLLALLVLLGMLLWALSLAGRARWAMGLVAAACIAFLGGVWGDNIGDHPAPAAATGDAAGRWRAWSQQAVQEALAQDKPVFVDFTAAWCVTCQYNKKTTLSSKEVLQAMDARGVQTFRADWTRQDAAISAELNRLGRSGVPVYLLIAPDGSHQVLSEVLSAADVLRALRAL
ncbi:MAG: thioredoxin family protein [Burkholderiaceae bacterium]|nr:thioredoxin family protein [Burkholderiaceae bacterium]